MAVSERCVEVRPVVGLDAAAGCESQPVSNASMPVGDFFPSTRLSKSTSPLDGLERPLEPTGAPKEVRALALVALEALFADRSLSFLVCSSSIRVDSDLIKVMND